MQFGDDPPNPFSFLNDKVWIEPEAQLPCHLTYTNERAHKIITGNIQEEEYIQEQNKNGLFVSSTTSATVQSVPISSMSCSATIDKTKEQPAARPQSRQLGNSRPVSRQRVASR